MKLGSRVLLGLGVCVVSLTAALVGTEVLLRELHPVDYRKPVERVSTGGYKDYVHRASPVPGLAYELAPGVRKRVDDMLIETNSLGMRDDEPASEKGADLVRIAAVGDSVTFGFGVSAAEAWPSVLERLLNDARAQEGRRFEVLNFGVSGYSSRDEALVVEHKALPIEPDLLILAYVLNDPETNPMQPLPAYYEEPAWWQHYHVFRWLAWTVYAREARRLGGGNYIRYLHAPGHGKWRSVLLAFDDIQRVTSARNVPVLVVVFPMNEGPSWSEYAFRDLHRQVVEAATDRGFSVLDLDQEWSGTEYAPRDLRLPEGHPNPLGHRLAGESILAALPPFRLEQDEANGPP